MNVFLKVFIVFFSIKFPTTTPYYSSIQIIVLCTNYSAVLYLYLVPKNRKLDFSIINIGVLLLSNFRIMKRK